MFKNTDNKLGQVLILGTASFLLGLGVTWYEVTAESLCMQAHDAHTVTYGMTAAMLILPVAGVIHTRLFSNRRLITTAAWSSGVVALVLLILAGSTATSTSEGVAIAMVVFIKFLATFTYVPFWQIVSRTFPGKQGTQQSLCVTAGFPLAQMIAGLTAGPAFARLGSSCVLLIVSVVVALAGAILCWHAWRQRLHSAMVRKTARVQSDKSRVSRYWLLIAGMVVLVTFVSTLISHLVRERAEAHYADLNGLAAGFGWLQAITGFVEIAVMLSLSSRIISRWGTIPGMVVFPGILLVAAFAMFSQLFGEVSMMFFIASFVKVLNSVIRPALFKPSMKLMIDVLTIPQRMKMITHSETIYRPLATAIAGFLILMSSWSSFGSDILVLMIVVCSFVWLLVGVSANRDYQVLNRVVSKTSTAMHKGLQAISSSIMGSKPAA